MQHCVVVKPKPQIHKCQDQLHGFILRDTMKKLCPSLEYTISKVLLDYIELNFKDEGLSNFISDT